MGNCSACAMCMCVCFQYWDEGGITSHTHAFAHACMQSCTHVVPTHRPPGLHCGCMVLTLLIASSVKPSTPSSSSPSLPVNTSGSIVRAVCACGECSEGG